MKPAFLLVGVILFASACRAANLTPPPSSGAPTETLSFAPSKIPRRAHTQTPTLVNLFSTPQETPFPVWVTDFSDPILAMLNGQRPDIQDDFINFNRGWFYFIPDSQINPFYAHIQNETLLIKLPAENENKDYWVYNPKLNRKNFVLSFDLQFEETQPQDVVRIQIDQTIDQSVALDLSKTQTWELHWGSRADWQSTAGVYNYFGPERINVLIVMQGKECAVYLNDAPLAYLNHCRESPIVRSSPSAVTFHMLAEPGHVAAATIDNLKLWDLDKISDIP